MFRSFTAKKSEWRERQRDFLVRVLARGKKRFILVHGTLWAIFFVVTTNLIDILVLHRFIDWGFLPISLAIALPFGYGWGFWTWKNYENKLLKLSVARH